MLYQCIILIKYLLQYVLSEMYAETHTFHFPLLNYMGHQSRDTRDMQFNLDIIQGKAFIA